MPTWSGSPLVWFSRCATVTAAYRAGSRPGSTRRTGASSASRPSATSWSTTVAMKALVMLPIRTASYPDTGRPVLRSATPETPRQWPSDPPTLS